MSDVKTEHCTGADCQCRDPACGECWPQGTIAAETNDAVRAERERWWASVVGYRIGDRVYAPADVQILIREPTAEATMARSVQAQDAP